MDLEETVRVLDKLAEWPGGALAKKLARQAGQKEARYAHLLSGEPDSTASDDGAAVVRPTRVAELEREIQQLRTEFDELKRRFDELEAQLR